MNHQAMQDRIQRIEAQNQRLRWGFVILLIAVGVAVTMGQSQPQWMPEVIRARRLEVVDEQGQVMVALWAGAHGGWVDVFQRGSDKATHTIGDAGRGSGSAAHTGEPQRLVELGATQLGGRVVVRSESGQPVCTMLTDANRSGVIGAWDERGMGRTLKPEP